MTNPCEEMPRDEWQEPTASQAVCWGDGVNVVVVLDPELQYFEYGRAAVDSATTWYMVNPTVSGPDRFVIGLSSWEWA